MTNFVEELRWRGMLQDIMPGTEEQLQKEITAGYIGFDPTADSLHVGSLAQIMTLLHLQKAGHKPIAVVGGATGMVGDPSGKSAERNLLSKEALQHNLSCIKSQLSKFLDFNCGAQSAEIINNYDWFEDFKVLDFAREVGKHITISYMLSKDSVQGRLETGMSFTEFMYQLFQGYDFYYLWKNKNVKLQMGGSDQWGNIITGTEFIRRKEGGQAFALTTKLITKADGGKFGKTEEGNVWLDAKKTSPYKFYQFWMNTSDEDAAKYIRIFTLMTKQEIEALENEHKQQPHFRLLQKQLAKEVTTRVHSEEHYHAAVEASEILFGKGISSTVATKLNVSFSQPVAKSAIETLANLSEDDLLSVFEGVPQVEVSKQELVNGINVVEFLSDKTQILPSRGEAKKMIQGGGIFINKTKIEDIQRAVSTTDLLKEKYILVQKGKKNYFLVKAV